MFGRKNNAVDLGKADSPATAPVGDDLGRFPTDVDSSPSADRAHERALRAVSIVAIVSAMMNIAFIMLMITLFPLQKVYPYLVTFKSKDQQVVSIDPIAMNAPGILYATEDNVRDYITQRHSFVPIPDRMKEQWGHDSRLAARTAPDLYQKFADASKTETAQMMTAGYTRNIDIKSVQRLSSSNGSETWQVAFDTNDTLPTQNGTLTPNQAYVNQANQASQPSPGAPVQIGSGNAVLSSVSPTQTQHWIATMRITYLPQKVTYDQRLLNPLGFTVTDYSVTRSGSEGQ